MRGVDLRELLDHNHVAERIEPSAAKVLGPRHPEQPELGHLLHVLPRELALRVPVGGGGGHFVAGELANHFARREVLVGEIERVVHRGR